MKNLRITKIITALIVTIWMPSSFADSPYPLNVKIINGTHQVNFMFNVNEAPSRLKLCPQSGVTCRAFNRRARDKNFWTKYAEDSKKSNDELFRELMSDWDTNQPIAAEINVGLMLMSITSSLRPWTTSQLNLLDFDNLKEVRLYSDTVSHISLSSFDLEKNYPLSTRMDFYNYLSKLRIVKYIAFDNTKVNPNNHHIKILVEDKVMEAFIKKLEEEFTEIEWNSEKEFTEIERNSEKEFTEIERNSEVIYKPLRPFPSL